MKRYFYLANLLLALVALVLPRAEATTGTVYNGPLNRCDVNGDGSVTAVDVTIIYNYMLGTEDVSNYDCDVNGDGSVTSVDITLIYNVILNGGYYNSIFDAFNLTVTSFLNRDYYKFTWDDVTTLDYGVTNPDYMLVIGTDENFTRYNCWHYSGTTVATLGKQTISEWLMSEFNWSSPSDVPNTITLYARVEVKLDNGNDVIISNEKQFLHFIQLSFDSPQPIHLWWLTGSFIGVEPWSNDGQPFGSYGMVPMYPVQGATYNEDGEGPLEYYGYFPAGGEFKIIENPGSWELVMGNGTENGGQVYSGHMLVGYYPDNIHINQGGYYKIDLNTASKTMTMTRLSDTQATYSTITMPGYYQNWVVENDPMSNVSPNDNHDWYRNFDLSSDSELKFAPGSWDYNWGTNQFPYGKGYKDGYNIPALAGNYYVYFNDLSGDYMFVDKQYGLEVGNFIRITQYYLGDFINLTYDYASSTTMKLCDISTDLESDLLLVFDDQSVAITSDGMVNLNELKAAVISAYNRPRTGGCNLNCHVEGHIGAQILKSNSIAIPVLIENYSINTESYGGGQTFAMNPIGLNTYNAIIPASTSDIYFKIAPESSSAAADMITSPYDYDIAAMNGSFGFGKQGYFKIPYNPQYSQYEVNINLGDKTFTIEGCEFPSTIWQAGNANNWGNPAAGLALNLDRTYTGYMFINTYFVLREHQYDWDGTTWGTDSYDYSLSGNLVVNGTNLYAPQGFYKVDVDLNSMHYNLAEISSVSVIGSAVPTGTQWATDVDLTYNQDTGAWEAYMVLNKGEFKFRANHEWTLNWGGTLDSIVEGGANLTVASPGPYLVQFFLTYNGNSHAVLTRQ